MRHILGERAVKLSEEPYSVVIVGLTFPFVCGQMKALLKPRSPSGGWHTGALSFSSESGKWTGLAGLGALPRLSGQGQT